MLKMKNLAKYYRCLIAFGFVLFIISCSHNDSLPKLSDFENTLPKHVSLLDYSSRSITISWDTIEEAVSYTVHLMNSKDRSASPLQSYTTTSKSSYKFSNLGDTISYYARVRANFNSFEEPVIGDWVYIMNEKDTARIIPAYGVVDENFKIPKIYSNFPEGFEDIIGDRKGSYTSSQSELYATGKWEMYRCYTTNSGSALLHKVGNFAAMLSPHKEGYVAMDFDLPYGANKLTFVTGSATKTNANDVNNMPITLSVFYSIDEGESWNKIDDILIKDVEKQYTPEYDNLDIESPVRFKFQKDDGTARPIVDEVTVYYTE